MRVTNSMVLNSTLRDLNSSLSRLQTHQATLSTGRTISKASDDPTGATTAMALRTKLRQSEQFGRVATFSSGWLATSDSAIVNGLDLMSRVKELAVQASNIGAATPTSRATLAAEIRHVRHDLLALANTKYLDRPVFNGTSDGSAYDADGNYLGNDAAVIRSVGPSSTLQVNLTGIEVFGDPAAPEGDLFAMLDRMATAIAAGDTDALAVEHANTDVARATMSAAAAQIGVRGARLEGIQHRLAADELTIRDALSQIEDADIAEALVWVKSSENAYNAALQAASKIITPSLVDYLR